MNVEPVSHARFTARTTNGMTKALGRKAHPPGTLPMIGSTIPVM